MVIVPLQGDIFRANVESYIILDWGLGCSRQWHDFLEITLGNGIKFKDKVRVVVREEAVALHSRVLKLDPVFKVSSCEPLKYLYFLRKHGRLRARLFKALDALNNKKVKSVAFNGDRDRHDKSVIKTGQIIRDWERKKIENKGRVFIEQVILVCPEDYFKRLIHSQEPLINPVFRYSKDQLDRIQEKLDAITEKLEHL